MRLERLGGAPDVGCSLKELLVERANAGVHVYVMPWSHPNVGALAENKAPEVRAMFEKLQNMHVRSGWSAMKMYWVIGREVVRVSAYGSGL